MPPKVFKKASLQKKMDFCVHFIYLLLSREQALSIQHNMFLLCDRKLHVGETIKQEAPFLLCISSIAG